MTTDQERQNVNEELSHIQAQLDANRQRIAELVKELEATKIATQKHIQALPKAQSRKVRVDSRLRELKLTAERVANELAMERRVQDYLEELQRDDEESERRLKQYVTEVLRKDAEGMVNSDSESEWSIVSGPTKAKSPRNVSSSIRPAIVANNEDASHGEATAQSKSPTKNSSVAQESQPAKSPSVPVEQARTPNPPEDPHSPVLSKILDDDDAAAAQDNEAEEGADEPHTAEIPVVLAVPNDSAESDTATKRVDEGRASQDRDAPNGDGVPEDSEESDEDENDDQGSSVSKSIEDPPAVPTIQNLIDSISTDVVPQKPLATTPPQSPIKPVAPVSDENVSQPPPLLLDLEPSTPRPRDVPGFPQPASEGPKSPVTVASPKASYGYGPPMYDPSVSHGSVGKAQDSPLSTKSRSYRKYHSGTEFDPLSMIPNSNSSTANPWSYNERVDIPSSITPALPSPSSVLHAKKKSLPPIPPKAPAPIASPIVPISKPSTSSLYPPLARRSNEEERATVPEVSSSVKSPKGELSLNSRFVPDHAEIRLQEKMAMWKARQNQDLPYRSSYDSTSSSSGVRSPSAMSDNLRVHRMRPLVATPVPESSPSPVKGYSRKLASGPRF